MTFVEYVYLLLKWANNDSLTALRTIHLIAERYFFALLVLINAPLGSPWWRYGMTGGGDAAEVRFSRRTMYAPVISLLSKRLALMLFLLLDTTEPSFSQPCPGLLASSSACSCTDERSKAHGEKGLWGRRVSCTKEDLLEPPKASLLPDGTVNLWVVNRQHVYHL